MEIILELLAEIFLQLIFETLAEAGIHFFGRDNKPNPIAAGIGYFLFGAALGALSLFLLPESFISSDGLRWLNLIVTPVVLGFIMAMIGKARTRKGKDTVRIERFVFGYLFAFGLALIRFLFAS